MKRVCDVAGSLSGLTICSPLLVVIALLVKSTSPGPVFFRQERVGRRFRRFFIYKFRTMVEDAPKRGVQITGRLKRSLG
jgi:lipopolysaccharide/colanic/teichoic acid biosynthesis glycosyltransferase